tara:strand:- start:1248 stop:1790 length:543 start_codon:yes stop_codon:yes gene_type:complete
MIFFKFLSAEYLNDFYRLLESSSVVKLKIRYTQNQFDKVFESLGDCYLINDEEYYYESNDIRFYAKKNQLITKNYITNQVVYSEVDRNQLNILDILSGSKDQMEFLDNASQSNKYHFAIPGMGFKGYFKFQENTGVLQSIHLLMDLNQTLVINVVSLEILKGNFTPKIDLENFEIIDLRD